VIDDDMNQILTPKLFHRRTTAQSKILGSQTVVLQENIET
jgi:hypothetical protein